MYSHKALLIELTNKQNIHSVVSGINKLHPLLFGMNNVVSRNVLCHHMQSTVLEHPRNCGVPPRKPLRLVWLMTD